MIIRHIPVKSGMKSSFSRLVQYITSKLGKHERLGITQVNNCQSQTIDWAVEEIKATQALNQRAISDKTYHLLVSFPAGEAPNEHILKHIEVAVCEAIGFREHQRISAVHHDTDNMHIHLAINKIHPATHTMHEPYLAYKTLAKTAEKLEQKFGLQKTNHTPSKSLSENHANDLEQHTGIESILSWIRTHCLQDLQKAQNWSEFNRILAANSLLLEPRGTGFVITNDKGIFVKASTIARDLSKSKLETRFGKFIPKKDKNVLGKQSLKDKPSVAKLGANPPPRSKGRFVYLDQIEAISFSQNKSYTNKPISTPVNTDALFKKYTLEMADIKINRIKRLNDIKKQKMEAIIKIRKNAQRKRMAVKLLNERPSKKILYNLISRSYKEELEKINTYYRELRLDITHNQWKTWIDWLKNLAVNNDTEALHVLRSRTVKKPLTGNTVSGFNASINTKAAEVDLDGITKSGTIIYRSGITAIRDDGKTIKVSDNYTEMCLKAALDAAVERYGNTIVINGSEHFKNEIIKITIIAYPDIRFSDPSLENKRQQELQKHTQLKEQKNAVRRSDLKRGRTVGSSITSNWRVGDGGGFSRRNFTNNFNKPNIERIGRKPSPASQNRLRTMSELGMVQFTDRGEVLLQGHVSDNLEQQGTKPNHGMRWDVSGAGIKGQEAAEKYIAERESKRLKGIDIFRHRLITQQDTGILEFAGLRTVDNQNLVLLKASMLILVYPVHESLVSKLKTFPLGEKINFTAKGISFKRGRKHK